MKDRYYVRVKVHEKIDVFCLKEFLAFNMINSINLILKKTRLFNIFMKKLSINTRSILINTRANQINTRVDLINTRIMNITLLIFDSRKCCSSFDRFKSLQMKIRAFLHLFDSISVLCFNISTLILLFSK